MPVLAAQTQDQQTINQSHKTWRAIMVFFDQAHRNGGDRVHAFGSHLTWPARSEPQGDPMREARTVVDATPKQSDRCVERPGYLKPAVLWEVRPASGTECPAECTCTVTHSDGALIQLEEVGIMLWVRGADLCGEQAVTRPRPDSAARATARLGPLPPPSPSSAA